VEIEMLGSEMTEKCHYKDLRAASVLEGLIVSASALTHASLFASKADDSGLHHAYCDLHQCSTRAPWTASLWLDSHRDSAYAINVPLSVSLAIVLVEVFMSHRAGGERRAVWHERL
jgi:hypothetical protein